MLFHLIQQGVGRSVTWAQERLLLCVRSDGPRLWLGRSATAQMVVFFAADLDLASREGPCRGGEILGCLGIGRPFKVCLVDAGLKRGEDSRHTE
jgi:hypothetical protein